MSVLAQLLSGDSFTLYRPQGGVDSEGIPYATFMLIGSYEGRWGTPQSIDIELAGRIDERIDAVIGGNFPARLGDKLVGLRGHDWVVLHVRETQVHKRVFLRQL